MQSPHVPLDNLPTFQSRIDLTHICALVAFFIYNFKNTNYIVILIIAEIVLTITTSLWIITKATLFTHFHLTSAQAAREIF